MLLKLIKVLGLSLYGPKAASHRVRLSQFKSGLALNGIDLQVQSLLSDSYLRRRYTGARPSVTDIAASYLQRLSALRSAREYDVVILYSELFPFIPALLELGLLPANYIYDLDDAFYLKYSTGRLGMFKPILGNKISALIAKAKLVTAGNSELSSFASQYNRNVTVIPSVVDTDVLIPHPNLIDRDPNRPFTVGWIGSPSTAPYLESLISPLQRLADELPVRLHVVGASPPLIPGVDVITMPWSLEHETSLIHQFDVGVMPLPQTPWARGKCAYKLIQCMSCAVPVIASAVGANISVVHPTCGILVNTAEEWLDALRQLAKDPELRTAMGLNARDWVQRKYSLHSALPLLASAIRSVVTSSTLLY